MTGRRLVGRIVAALRADRAVQFNRTKNEEPQRGGDRNVGATPGGNLELIHTHRSPRVLREAADQEPCPVPEPHDEEEAADAEQRQRGADNR